MYKQSIILFGIVIPLVLAAAVIGGGIFLKKQMAASYETRSAEYLAYNRTQTAAFQVEAKIAKQRPHLARWKTELAEEPSSAMRTHLKAISDKLPPKEFMETSFTRVPGKGGFGSASVQQSSQVAIGFRGTFRSVQRGLAELEARMPQLQLQELKIDPTQQGNLLNFQVSYTAWEN